MGAGAPLAWWEVADEAGALPSPHLLAEIDALVNTSARPAADAKASPSI